MRHSSHKNKMEHCDNRAGNQIKNNDKNRGIRCKNSISRQSTNNITQETIDEKIFKKWYKIRINIIDSRQ